MAIYATIPFEDELSMRKPLEMTTQSYGRGGRLFIVDTDGNDLIEFGNDFFKSTSCGSWNYIRHQLQSCYTFQGSMNKAHFLDSHGKRVDERRPLKTGWITFTGKKTGRKNGPRGAYRANIDRAEKDGEPSSNPPSSPARSGSGSSRPPSRGSSGPPSRPPSRGSIPRPGHADLKSELKGRDGLCIISGTSFIGCEASHILPHARPEYYVEALQYLPQNLSHLSYGLTLDATIYHSFARLEIALWPLGGGDLEVHVFVDIGTKAIHGHKIPRSVFRCADKDLPDETLLLWHYQQCAMARFRRPENSPPSRPR